MSHLLFLKKKLYVVILCTLFALCHVKELHELHGDLHYVGCLCFCVMYTMSHLIYKDECLFVCLYGPYTNSHF